MSNHDFVERIRDSAGTLLALLVRAGFDQPGATFFTEPDLSQQLAYIRHPAGKVINPHRHPAVSAGGLQTQEVLLIRSGRLRVDFYDHARSYVQSRILEAGDVILLITGGHGYEMLGDVRMFEVKRGPFGEPADRQGFPSTTPATLRFSDPGSE